MKTLLIMLSVIASPLFASTDKEVTGCNDVVEALSHCATEFATAMKGADVISGIHTSSPRPPKDSKVSTTTWTIGTAKKGNYFARIPKREMAQLVIEQKFEYAGEDIPAKVSYACSIKKPKAESSAQAPQETEGH
jgi:hypothetical protein